MREDALKWVDLKIVANSLNGFSDFLVSSSDLDGSSGGKEGVVCGRDNISLLYLRFVSYNYGMGGNSCVAVNMGTEFDLDQVTSGEFLRIIWAR